MSEFAFRAATRRDAGALAALHADSWRRTYRGVYTDDYLDGAADADRLAVWTARLRQVPGSAITILAEGTDGVAGFVHAVPDDDPRWGSLIDNLHVAAAHQRRGLGTALLRRAAAAIAAHATQPGVYLWVQERNTAAQRFYATLGGERAGEAASVGPGGIAERLVGSPVKLRIHWPDAAALTSGG